MRITRERSSSAVSRWEDVSLHTLRVIREASMDWCFWDIRFIHQASRIKCATLTFTISTFPCFF